MDDLEKYMEKQMKNPEFRKEYKETKMEFERNRILIKISLEEESPEKKGMSGIHPSCLSR
ncbi:hypothetical protein [Dialister sp.]|uniref:hypothetical protein n=1 Tax=Dialister sp. TaxID=1955814 RepID=UPI002E81DFAF|nr:hypothetical protein [Dialister sp.]MEE3453404.1 hypothetical protein [Dialister sp.]